MNKPDSEERFDVAAVTGFQSLSTVPDCCCFCRTFGFVSSTISCIKSSGKTKFKKSPGVDVAGRIVVGPVRLLKSLTITNSRSSLQSSSPPLSTELLSLSSSSVELSSAEISLSPDISALAIPSVEKPKNSSSSLSLSKISLKSFVFAHQTSNFKNSQKFEHAVSGDALSSQGTIKPSTIGGCLETITIQLLNGQSYCFFQCC